MYENAHARGGAISMDGHDNQTENAFGRRRRPPEDSDPTRKRLDVAQKLTNDIAARIGEHAMIFNDARRRGRHLTKPVCGDRVKIASAACGSSIRSSCSAMVTSSSPKIGVSGPNLQGVADKFTVNGRSSSLLAVPT
jgi:hypothetical protein